MRRDILFLVRGIPESYRFHDQHYFMAGLGEPMVDALAKLAPSLEPLRVFLSRSKPEPITSVGFRNEYDNRTEAIARAAHQLGGIIDGLSFLAPNEAPDVSEVIQVREGDSPDVKVLSYIEAGWAHFHSKLPASRQAWEERTNLLFSRLLLFFDMAARDDDRYRNDLCLQLRHSAKMHRYGGQAKAWGIEFICKFAALEGLVCGALRNNKGQTLNRRLSQLFHRDSSTSKLVQELWELRCVASHQSKAFNSDYLPGSPPLQLKIDNLDRYFSGVLVFALDHADVVTTIDELWLKVGEYQLPEWAAMSRPNDMPRLPAGKFVMDYHVTGTGIGRFFDECFERTAKLMPT